MKTSTLSILASAAALVVLSACGGGGGGSSVAQSPSAGTGDTPTQTASSNLAQGTITGFGSVYLDGEKYDTDAAEFYKDGERSSQDQFRVGMKVKLSGDFDDDRADLVSYDEDVKGPIDQAYDGDTGILVVLGQTVRIIADTRFDDSLDLNALVVGDLLEVSGYRDADDVIEASYVELKRDDNTTAFKVIGQVRELDTDAQEFSIGGLRVGYATAELDDIRQLEDGLLVEVKDANKSYSPGLFSLQATKVEAESYSRPDELAGDDDQGGDELEIEGIISAVGESAFTLGGLEVTYDSQTTFIYGDAALLEVGTKVKVEGTLVDADTLDARKVKFSRNAVRISSMIELINYDTRVVTVLGVDVQVPVDADLKDEIAEGELAFEDLLTDEFVEIRGRYTSEGVIASELKRTEPDDTELRGVATDVDPEAMTLKIVGVPVKASEFTEFEIDDDDDGVDDGFDDSATASDFFALLNDGQSVVEAKWNGIVVDTSSVAAEELELED